MVSMLLLIEDVTKRLSNPSHPSNSAIRLAVQSAPAEPAGLPVGQPAGQPAAYTRPGCVYIARLHMYGQAGVVGTAWVVGGVDGVERSLGFRLDTGGERGKQYTIERCLHGRLAAVVVVCVLLSAFLQLLG